MAETNPALLIANNHESGKTESATALHHLGNPINMDQAVDEFAIAFFPIVVTTAAATITITCHFIFRHLRGCRKKHRSLRMNRDANQSMTEPRS
jgi:hypothetical protein